MSRLLGNVAKMTACWKINLDPEIPAVGFPEWATHPSKWALAQAPDPARRGRPSLLLTLMAESSHVASPPQGTTNPWTFPQRQGAGNSGQQR